MNAKWLFAGLIIFILWVASVGAENEFYWKSELIAIEENGVWNLKKENGVWTDLKEPNEIRFYYGLANGKRAFIVRIQSLKSFPQGETLVLRYFHY